MSDEERRLTLHSEVHESDPSQLAAAGLVPPQRRGAFLRYVGIAVALCFVLCLAALARIALAHNHPAEPVGGSVAVTATTTPTVETVAPAAPSAAPVTPVAAASAGAVPVPVASAEFRRSNLAAPVPDVPTKSAVEEREAARKALERGKIDGAVMAALRSTSIDPTDADAWLLLGAAYQTAGKSADARAAYGACAKEAKKGAVRECQLMLR